MSNSFHRIFSSAEERSLIAKNDNQLIYNKKHKQPLLFGPQGLPHLLVTETSTVNCLPLFCSTLNAAEFSVLNWKEVGMKKRGRTRTGESKSPIRIRKPPNDQNLLLFLPFKIRTACQALTTSCNLRKPRAFVFSQKPSFRLAGPPSALSTLLSNKNPFNAILEACF